MTTNALEMIVILFLSMIILASSSDWILIWIGLEVNTFVFLMFNKNIQLFKTEFEFKYYLIQFIGSSLFFLGCLFNYEMFIYLSLMVKLIMIPFLNWILDDLKWLSLKFQIMFLSIQKIGPLLVLWNFHPFLNFICWSFLFLNLIASVILGLSLNHWMDLLAFSSAGQSVLLIFLILVTKTSFIIFLISYIISIIYILMTFNFNQEMIFLYIIVSGFPPSLLFLAKINFIYVMSQSSIMFLMILTLFFGGMSYVYMKIFLQLSLKTLQLKKSFFFNGGSLMLINLFMYFG